MELLHLPAAHGFELVSRHGERGGTFDALR